MTAPATHRTRRPPRCLATALAAVVMTALCCSPTGDRQGEAVSAADDSPERVKRHLPAETGATEEARIGPGEVHVYTVDAGAGTAHGVEIDQNGADVAVDLLAPDGTRITTVDSYTGEHGVEYLFWISETAGPHRLEVQLLDAGQGGRSGGYTVSRTVGPRTPTGEDRLRLRADRAFEHAFALSQRPELSVAAAAEAADAFSRAAELFGRLGRDERRARALNGLGGIQLDRAGEPEAAAEAFRQAAELQRRAGRPLFEGRMLSRLGDALRKLNRDAGAIAAYEASREIFAADGHHPALLASIDNNLGLIHSRNARSEDALEHFERSLEISAAAGSKPDPVVVTNLADEYRFIGDLRRALRLYEEAVALAATQGKAAQRGWSLSKMCHTLKQMGRLRKAETCIRDAIDLHRANDDPRGEAAGLVTLAQIAESQGDVRGARSNQRAALEVYRAEEDRLATAIILNNLGWTEIEAGDPAAARDHFLQALPTLEEFGQPRETVNTLAGLARAYGELGALDQALHWNRRAIAVTERLRRGPAAPVQRAHALARRLPIYGYQVELLMRLHHRHPDAGWDAAALTACERARARSLLETLIRFQLDGSDPGGEPATEEGRLEQRLAELERRRSALFWKEGYDREERLAALEVEIAEAELAWQRVRARRVRLHDSDPAQANPLDADAVRRMLDGETLMLSYHLGRQRSFLWAVTAEGIESHVLPPRRDVEAAARRAHELTAESRRHTRRIPAGLALLRLSRMLLEPVADRLPEARRLLVVGEGALLYVPFAGLPRPADGRPLVAGHEVVVLPSASTLAALRRRIAGRPPAPGVVAVMADPVFRPDDPRLTGAAPNVTTDWQTSLQRSGESFHRLPYSRREAEAILDLAPSGDRYLATGFDASLDAVVSGALSGYRVVHLATHARVNTDRPNTSGLMLSRFAADGTPRPGVLRSDQIYRLHIPADLVTLSACRTALGEEIRGEGLVGLTHGFLTAGSARVLVSLWDVGDESTAVLMERFYHGLFQRRLSPAAALRAAQISMWRDERWRVPYHWAGFILLGEPG